LAEGLIHYSTNLQPGENILIEAIDIPDSLVRALIRTVVDRKAKPDVWIKQNGILRDLLLDATEEQLKRWGENELALMKQMDAYVGIRGSNNINELSDVPADKMKMYQDFILKPVHFEERVKNTKWVILRYPNSSFAQQAGMSTEAFEDFFYNVCTLDYAKMEKAMLPLRDLMNRTDRVEIKGPDTDLRFSIKDIPAIICSGTHNIPDGEVYTAPVRDSVEGRIKFNTQTIYQGVTFSDIELVFEKGKIVEAHGDKTEKLNEFLNVDEGARYIGEFALGFNPYITKPILDILFDEKIAGSFHFTPGNAYDEADNGNRSAVHWDMVQIQTPETGGGEIYFDGQLVRKDGLFLADELKGLNPENLK
ncbi:MAG: aminopeptidase, partial [Calditrichia bacterium]